MSLSLAIVWILLSVQLFVVPILKWEVKGTLEEGEKAIQRFQVKMKPQRCFVAQWLLSTSLSFYFQLTEVYCLTRFVSKTTSPFPHSICDATKYAGCSQLLRRSESRPPRAVHLYQWGPPAAGLQCYLTTHPNFIHSKWFPSSCQFLVK